MKRWLAWILIMVCIFSGCSDQPDSPTGTTEVTQPKNVSQERSLYWQDNALEKSTGGAVKVYGTDDEVINGIGFMDGNIVLFNARDNDTFLTRIAVDTGAVKAEKLVSGELYTDMLRGSSNVVISGNRLAYYDGQENVIRILDPSFKETGKIKLQHEPEGAILIGSNLSVAYYCAGGDIRAMDLQTGIAKLICQRVDETISLETLLLDDAVICCVVSDSEGNSWVEFLDASNGLTLATDRDLLTIESCADSWLATRLDGVTREILVGDRTQVFSFMPDNTLGGELQLLDSGILEWEVSSGKALLSLYHKETGNRMKRLELDGIEAVYGALEAPDKSCVWLVCRDTLSRQDILVCWTLDASGGEDQAERIAMRHTANNPDTVGLSALKQEALRIGDKYGVQIHIAQDIPQPVGYTVTYEYQVQAFSVALETLDRALAKLPEGFLEIVARATRDKKLHIGLVRSVRTDSADGNPKTDGVQYLVDDSAWIAISVGEGLELSFFHNLSHVLDTYVYSYSIYYDFWDSCNPKDFQYDESYLHIADHTGSPYLSGQDRAFIDAFSMTFAHEDRATVFAYAMMENTEDYFESRYMQAKLKRLSVGIREAFGWETVEEILPWERYMK